MTFYLARMSVTEPLVYHIRVAGTLAPDFSDYVSGMTITADTAPDGSAVSDLHGTLPDHSALVGALRSLTNLGLPIINVQCLGVPGETSGGQSAVEAEPLAGAVNDDASADGDGIAAAGEGVAAGATPSPDKGGHGRLGAGVGAFVGGLLGLASGPEGGVAGAVIGSGVGMYLGKKSRSGESWAAGLGRLRRPFTKEGKLAPGAEPAAAPGEA